MLLDPMKVGCINGHSITWIFHQILCSLTKGNLQRAKLTIPASTTFTSSSPHLMDELIDQ